MQNLRRARSYLRDNYREICKMIWHVQPADRQKHVMSRDAVAPILCRPEMGRWCRALCPCLCPRPDEGDGDPLIVSNKDFFSCSVPLSYYSQMNWVEVGIGILEMMYRYAQEACTEGRNTNFCNLPLNMTKS